LTYSSHPGEWSGCLASGSDTSSQVLGRRGCCDSGVPWGEGTVVWWQWWVVVGARSLVRMFSRLPGTGGSTPRCPPCRCWFSGICRGLRCICGVPDVRVHW